MVITLKARHLTLCFHNHIVRILCPLSNFMLLILRLSAWTSSDEIVICIISFFVITVQSNSLHNGIFNLQFCLKHKFYCCLFRFSFPSPTVCVCLCRCVGVHGCVYVYVCVHVCDRCVECKYFYDKAAEQASMEVRGYLVSQSLLSIMFECSFIDVLWYVHQASWFRTI